MKYRGSDSFYIYSLQNAYPVIQSNIIISKNYILQAFVCPTTGCLDYNWQGELNEAARAFWALSYSKSSNYIPKIIKLNNVNKSMYNQKRSLKQAKKLKNI